MNDTPASESPEVVTSKGIGSSALLGSVSFRDLVKTHGLQRPLRKPEISMKQRAQADWWRRFLNGRVKFPQTGAFFIAPDDDEPWCAWLVHETGRKIDFLLDHGETWEQSRSTFAHALPFGTVSLPTCVNPDDAPRPDPRSLPNDKFSEPSL